VEGELERGGGKLPRKLAGFDSTWFRR